jgi:hypothetical protein
MTIDRRWTGIVTMPLQSNPFPKEATMKKSSMILTTVLFAIGSAMASAQTATPVAGERQDNQRQRINQGVASGELTKKEAAVLRTEQRAIKAEKKAFKADGKVTAAERAKLRRDQNQASRHIYNKKHNAKKPA